MQPHERLAMANVEASLRSLLNDPTVASYRRPESSKETYAPPPELLGFERINGDVVARVKNGSTGQIIMIGLDSFGQLAPRHYYGS